MKFRRGGDSDGTPERERDRDRETLRDIVPVMGAPDAQSRSPTPMAGTPAAHSRPGRSNSTMRAPGCIACPASFCRCARRRRRRR
jgi:hypothetical protein